MSVQILSAREYSIKLKVTIQSTGKLGFTDETAKALNLSEGTYITLGQDDKDSDLLYLILTDESEDAFKVCKAGDYYYLPTRRLFLSLGYEFQDKTIMFDLTRVSELDDELKGTVYKMNCRENDKRRKKK